MGYVHKAMMEKDFDKWGERKKSLDALPIPDAFVCEGQIWWCSLGVNIGCEQDGQNNLFERPVLVLAKFNLEMIVILPLTFHGKNDRYHFRITQGSLVLSQIRMISPKRLNRYIRNLRAEDFLAVKLSLKSILGL